MIFSGLITAIVARIQAHRAYKQRLRELESLDDRELGELGLARCDIDWLARQG